MKKLYTALAAAALIIAAAPIATPVAAQGLAHSWIMRGQIVAVTDSQFVICIGRDDGATQGQVLDVVRIVVTPGPRGSYRRENVGQIRIDEVFDAHFARASLVSGRADRHDLVELTRAR